MGNVKGGKKGGCGDMLGIATSNGSMVFAPNNIGGYNFESNANNFCYGLKKSYESSGGVGNKVVPLASSGTCGVLVCFVIARKNAVFSWQSMFFGLPRLT